MNAEEQAKQWIAAYHAAVRETHFMPSATRKQFIASIDREIDAHIILCALREACEELQNSQRHSNPGTLNALMCANEDLEFTESIISRSPLYTPEQLVSILHSLNGLLRVHLHRPIPVTPLLLSCEQQLIQPEALELFCQELLDLYTLVSIWSNEGNFYEGYRLRLLLGELLFAGKQVGLVPLFRRFAEEPGAHSLADQAREVLVIYYQEMGNCQPHSTHPILVLIQTQASEPLKARLIREVLQEMREQMSDAKRAQSGELIQALFTQTLPFPLDDIQSMLQSLCHCFERDGGLVFHHFYAAPFQALLEAFLPILKQGDALDVCRAEATLLYQHLSEIHWFNVNMPQNLMRLTLRELLFPDSEGALTDLLKAQPGILSVENDTDAQKLLALYHQELGGGVIEKTDPLLLQFKQKLSSQARMRMLRLAVQEAHLLAANWGPHETCFDCIEALHIHQDIALIEAVGKKSLPFTPDEMYTIITQMHALFRSEGFFLRSLPFLLATFQSHLALPEVLERCHPLLEEFRDALHNNHMHLSTTEQRKSLLIVSDLLSQRQQQFSYPLLPDAWGTPILEELVAMPEAERVPWLALLYHCAKANVAVPPVHWLEHTHTLRASIGSEGCDRTIHRWISLFSDKKGSRMDDANSDILRGLIWCCTGSADRLLASLLADAAIEGYRKLSGLGPRAPKVAGAAVQTLESMPGMYAISQLERVRLNVKQPSYQVLIGRSLDALARRENMTRIDLEELTVPTFDLQDGRVLFPSDSFTAQIMVDGRNAHVQWLDEHGEPYKHLPAAIKRSLKKEMKDLQRLSGDIEHMLSAQRQRLEQLPLSERQWTLANWQERYLFHPLLGLLVKRLIWQFRVGEQVLQGIWYEGRLVDVQNTPLEFPAETLVSLWHPLMSSADEVQRWRLWLEEWQVTQPFKQAHREIYLLTDAERGTGDYSMRFAGHFIGQYQFSALARVRGWNFSLLIDYAEANDGPATLHLAHWNLQAEFEVRGHLGDADGGSYPYVTSGEVRFWPIQPEQFPRHYMPLEQVPPILFSEVMRDVDLFVSVTNIGMNPYDSYGESALQHYWKTYNQSELSLSAEERKALLTRLIPRLPIAERCSFEDRFLKVRGDLRSYRIHLGSGNILMEPDDHYLCIVFNLKKQGSAGGQYFLPFEGDAILALILSKAFLLADDTHITDPSILSQIKSQRSPMR